MAIALFFFDVVPASIRSESICLPPPPLVLTNDSGVGEDPVASFFFSDRFYKTLHTAILDFVHFVIILYCAAIVPLPVRILKTIYFLEVQ